MNIHFFGICGSLLALILIFPVANHAEERKASQDRQLSQVPVKDAFGWALNNLTLGAGDFSRRDRKIWKKRPGSSRGGRRRYRPRPRGRRRYGHRHYYDDREYDSDESMSPETNEYDDYVRRRPSYPYRTRPRGGDPCARRRSRGGCADLQERWYYNNRIAECRPFTYGGCGGNANNFVSKKNCENFCAGGYKSKDKVTETDTGETVEVVETVSETETVE